MRTDEEIVKFPALRPDLKISRQVQSEKVTFIVKDPLKNEYYKFDESEWRIISLFDGKLTLPEMVSSYAEKNRGLEITLEDIKNYRESLTSIDLIEKSKRDQNVMLVEKMREMRSSQLLSKKGSLMYKRFPIVDPDKFFDRVIPHIQFFWTKGFFIFGTACIGLMFAIIFSHWPEFVDGLRDIFSFSNMSFWHLLILWVTIYATIAIHELGHGLTCKYYGGEVHEIGLLLMFFQPCLYANVNDAWLFDKKWKQVMVTVAGAYIELWVGSIFAVIWALTNPLSFINVLSFQVVTICTASTVLANFNPLMKLDGYYLLSDFLEIPNLRENAFKYVQYLIKTRIFRMKEEEFEVTRREQKIYVIYGLLATFWVGTSTLGLFFLAKGMLVDHFHEIGIFISFWIAYKLFSGHVKKAGKFLITWLLPQRAYIQEKLKQKNVRIAVGGGAALFLALLSIPLPFSVPGHCSLEPSFIEVMRVQSDGVLREFIAHDGQVVNPGDKVARLENFTLEYDRKIAQYSVQKMDLKIRQALSEDPTQVGVLRRELIAKSAEFSKKDGFVKKLEVTFPLEAQEPAVLSCDDEIRKLNKFLKKGDEICRALGSKKLRAMIDVSETQLRFIQSGDPVEFKLKASPFHTYRGSVQKIKLVGTKNPKNPKERTYQAELLIENPGDLRPGMSGTAKINAKSVSLATNMGRKLTQFFRLDLFF